MKTKLIGESELSLGTINTTLVSPREVFAEALRRNAAAVILLHNHPSGNPEPSKEDINVTFRIRDCGELLGIPLMDHIIIGDNCFFSFREQDILTRKGK